MPANEDSSNPPPPAASPEMTGASEPSFVEEIGNCFPKDVSPPRKICRTEVTRHRTPDSIWIIIDKKVYDVTNFVAEVRRIGIIIEIIYCLACSSTPVAMRPCSIVPVRTVPTPSRSWVTPSWPVESGSTIT